MHHHLQARSQETIVEGANVSKILHDPKHEGFLMGSVTPFISEICCHKTVFIVCNNYIFVFRKFIMKFCQILNFRNKFKNNFALYHDRSGNVMYYALVTINRGYEYECMLPMGSGDYEQLRGQSRRAEGTGGKTPSRPYLATGLLLRL